ncbi:MAG: YbhB/YbcL family Raf kinase inhibitor-like protein, partial [Hyphomicrobiales bacterium]
QRQEETQRRTDTPLLRVSEAKVGDDSGRVDFTLYPGEVVGITGLDGQGQADFVRAIAGVQSLRAGRIMSVYDQTAHAVSDLRSARDNGITYVSGDRKNEGIYANLSIFENLALSVYHEHRAGGWLNLINRTKLQPIFDWETDKLSVKMAGPNDLITSLSGGNQQKVLIARAFAEKPSVLVLNDPARGIDVGAKFDLYRNLRSFAARGNAVVFLSSETEEFLNLCSRVLVFRNGSISNDFDPPFDSHVILNAMFGRRGPALLPGEAVAEENPHHASGNGVTRKPARGRGGIGEDGRPIARPVHLVPAQPKADLMNQSGFLLQCPDFAQGETIPVRFVEDSDVSPCLRWSNVPDGTMSFALSVTDPDLPPEFDFPRSFAHWLVYNIPAGVRELPEGASRSLALPAGAQELNSDFVSFGIPGFGTGWGGPWPPDREHRYVFTLYALKAPKLILPEHADLVAFAAEVAPVAIDQALFTAVYGPARKTLPTADEVTETTGGEHE